MSRDIKFRAYLEGFKKMCAVKSIDFQMGTLWVKHGFKDTSPIYDFIGDHAVPLMQYTGINDKNGVGIYEGDYVECKTVERSVLSPDYVSGYLKGVVEYYDNCFCVKSESGAYHMHWTNAEEIEVIGNIHENKELLK